MTVDPFTSLPRRRMPAEERRVLIVDAARRLFAERGYYGVGTSEIAAAAGCSEPIVYRHFASKQLLFAAVLDEATGELAAELDEAIASDRSFTAFSRRLLAKLDDPDYLRIVKLRSLAAAMSEDPDIRSAMQRRGAEMKPRWVAIIRAAQERGEIRADIPPEHVSTMLLGVSFVCGFNNALMGERAVSGAKDAARSLLKLLRPTNPEGGPA